MGSKWNNGSRDIGGILRKTNQQTTVETETRCGDLLVFGYACKIFRDDDKALHIDQGKHLIPWMGDEALKIDRYDVRAALSDLSQYEPPPGGYTNRLECLTPAEQRAEQLCEEERYYSLYHNEEEEQMYQEEELKRLHQEASAAYGSVQFDYNNQKSEKESKNDEEKSEEADEAFAPPQNLVIPPNIVTPETMKLHAIIEKTAKFISSQGPQMEILIKAKQSNNPQFEFLNQNNKLNPYYKFVLNAFKNGTYPEQVPVVKPENSSNFEAKTIPTLDSTNSEPQPQTVFAHPASIRIPTVKYKPSADCAYTQLISKIKGVPIPQEQPNDVNSPDAAETTPTLYYSSYYAPNHGDHDVYNQTDQHPAIEQQQQKPIVVPATGGVEIKKISSGLMLAQCYASDTEEETDTDESKPHPVIPQNFTLPPDGLQNIIDKTAIYVAKNGIQFENILRTKQDERFTFLDPSDQYYPYYLHKVTSLNSSYVPSNSNGHDRPKIITPVSFSIKTKEESSVPINPALLQETSDDDDAENKAKSTGTSQQSQSSAPEKPTPSPNAAIAAATAARITAAIASANAAQAAAAAAAATNGGNAARSRFDIDNTGATVNRANSSVTLSGTGASKLETTQQKELKRAEEKVKDRLAQIAREKLGLISKEKQLQLERKKRAMAFLNQIKNSGLPLSTSSPSDSTTPPRNHSVVPNKDASNDNSDSEASSVHSIPITSYQKDDDDGADDENSYRCPDPIDRSKSIDRSRPVEKKILKNIHKYDDNNGNDSVTEEKSGKIDGHSKKRKRSRSRSKDSSSRHRHKKKKSKHIHESRKRRDVVNGRRVSAYRLKDSPHIVIVRLKK
ncbi:unnamed protein product [Hermetia illucens]|uniref:SURP motif domain-containing protein n=1 Tax=Hermetia illucens TaxID=343691 RepID=A0A7R8UTF4_HERIL|nr:unnamed protein product [Hermetia illucens]